MSAGDAPRLPTAIGSSTPDSITVAGRDLPAEIMGRLSLTELAYLLLTGDEPDEHQRRMLDAVLVSLADHGLTPSALAARFTYTGAPESPQAAIAAGLLGAGSVFLGPAGDTAEMLHDAFRDVHTSTDALQRTMARSIVADHRRDGTRVPGLGHPVHRVEDPRTPRIYELAEEEGLHGRNLTLLTFVADAYAEAAGRRLPINGAGAAGAALLDVGVPAGSVRGFVLIARTAGLVAHLAEEAQDPIGLRLWHEAESALATLLTTSVHLAISGPFHTLRRN